MATKRRDFTQEEIDYAWNHAEKVDGYKETEYRKDYAGAWMQYDKHGVECPLGWEVDHQKPLAEDGTYDLGNLVALQWQNNRKKGDDYPKWKTAITSDGDHNIEKIRSWYVK